MEQSTLFDTSQLDSSFASELWGLVKENSNWDWVKLWDEFEDKGYSVIFDFEFRGIRFWFATDQDNSYMNEREIYTFTETDVYDSNLTKKVKGILKKYIIQNVAAWEYMSNQKNK